MARASKCVDQDVIGTLEKIAEEVLETTGFFSDGVEPFGNAVRRANSLGTSIPTDATFEDRQSVLLIL